MAERRNTVDIHIPEELRAKIPQMGDASEQEDPMVWVKLASEALGTTWYILALEYWN